MPPEVMAVADSDGSGKTTTAPKSIRDAYVIANEIKRRNALRAPRKADEVGGKVP